jgi:hypothetical protein
MTTFPCFASSFDFFNNPAVLDVATIITDFRARVTGQVPAWTEPVAGTFKSPVDGVGRFFTVTLTRVSAQRLNWLVQDQNAITVANREIDISGLGTSVNYYTGQFHAYIENLEATPEIAQAGILDETPLAQNAILDYTFGNGYRNAGSGVDGVGGQVNLQWMLDNGAPGLLNRFRAYWQTIAAQISLKDQTGALQFFPADMFATIAGLNNWIGRAYQVYLCDASLPFGTQKTIQIGNAGETGVFQVIGLTTVGSAREMVRVA